MLQAADLMKFGDVQSLTLAKIRLLGLQVIASMVGTRLGPGWDPVGTRLDFFLRTGPVARLSAKLGSNAGRHRAVWLR